MSRARTPRDDVWDALAHHFGEPRTKTERTQFGKVVNELMEAGAHVFLEKPIAETVADAERVIATAVRTKRKLVIGYILRHHPSWMKFVELARTLGRPLVFRMNLNQQSSGAQWETHKKLMQSLSPIVDCGVHYVDIWCQITPANPVSVHAVGARLTEDLPPGRYQPCATSGSRVCCVRVLRSRTMSVIETQPALQEVRRIPRAPGSGANPLGANPKSVESSRTTVDVPPRS